MDKIKGVFNEEVVEEIEIIPFFDIQQQESDKI